jgi:hypothetical protein
MYDALPRADALPVNGGNSVHPASRILAACDQNQHLMKLDEIREATLN